MKISSPEYRRAMMGIAVAEAAPSEAAEMYERFGVHVFLTAVSTEQRVPYGQISYVYLLETRTDDERYFKIGKACKPHMRLRQIQRDSVGSAGTASRLDFQAIGDQLSWHCMTNTSLVLQ